MKITAPGGLQVVSVDGVTITGNGTPASPLVGASSTPAGWPIGWFRMPGVLNASFFTKWASTANTYTLYGFSLEAQMQFNKIIVYIPTDDGTGLYDCGIYTAAGALVAHIGAQHLTSSGLVALSVSGGPITLNPGNYYFATTGNATTATICEDDNTGWSLAPFFGHNLGTTAGGALPSTITPPTNALESTDAPLFALSL